MPRKIAVALAFLISIAGQHKIPASPLESSDIGRKVDEYVQTFLSIKNFSGSVLIAKEGKILVRRGYGMANYELDVPNTPESRFHIASISKTFTAAAILLLEERGSLSVDDPLTKFIPDYPSGDRITVYHLLTHTSGIPNVNDFLEYSAKSKSPQTPESIIAMFKNRRLIMEPGEKYGYSNSNYNVLAFIIEKLSGQSYGAFLKGNIFDPLGMKDTAHDARPQDLIPHRASGYVPAGLEELENAPYLDWSIKTGNGSLISTVDDLYKWDRALYTDKILKRATRERMFAVPYGWFVGKKHERRVVRYNGRSPGFQCEIQRYVDDDACLIVLSNNYSGTASLMIDDLAAILFGEDYEVPRLASSRQVDKRTAESVIGTYQGGQDFVRPGARLSVENRGDYLALNWGGGYISALVPLADGSFLDRLFGGRVEFERDQRGQVDELIWRSAGEYRARKLASDK
jgi:CubicO group peptidase (beta-lactamase class C family)